jgi:hypothetical protein
MRQATRTMKVGLPRINGKENGGGNTGIVMVATWKVTMVIARYGWGKISSI